MDAQVDPLSSHGTFRRESLPWFYMLIMICQRKIFPPVPRHKMGKTFPPGRPMLSKVDVPISDET